MTEWILNQGKPLEALRTNPTLGHRPHPPAPFNNFTLFYLFIYLYAYIFGRQQQFKVPQGINRLYHLNTSI